MSKPLASLIPSIDKRITAWNDIHRHLVAQTAVKVRPTVTLSRSFGCEGYRTAERIRDVLAKATGEPWNIYDKALLEAVASEQGIEMYTLKNLGDTARSFERLGMRPPDYLQHQDAYRAVAEKVVALAAVGNAVVIGRGGAVLCAQLPNCFHFRIDASLDFRVASIARRLEMPPEEARALVEANTKLRNEFLREQLHVDPFDARHFHALFDNERADAEVIAEAIAAFVLKAWSLRAPT